MSFRFTASDFVDGEHSSQNLRTTGVSDPAHMHGKRRFRCSGPMNRKRRGAAGSVVSAWRGSFYLERSLSLCTSLVRRQT